MAQTTSRSLAMEPVRPRTTGGYRLMSRMRPLACAVLLALAGSASAQADATSPPLRERLGFSGPVSRVVTEEEREDVARRVRSIDRYREDGHPEERTVLLFDFLEGTLRQRIVTFYDEAGRELSRETTDADGELVGQVLYRYGDGVGVIEEVTYGPDGAVTKRVAYARNDADEVTEQVTYDAQGSISAREVVEYDADRNLVRHESHRGANLERVVVMTYASDGTPLTRDTYGADGRLLGSRAYSDGGLFQEETAFDEAGEVQRRWTATLDERGNFRELLEYDLEGEVSERSTYTYDERHLLVEETYEAFLLGSPTTFVTRYAYEFDEQGNWTRRVTTEAMSGSIETSTVMETLYRTIEYHPGR